MHPRYWHKLADMAPPSGIHLLVCYDPRHLAPPVCIAKLDPGRGWHDRGERIPEPLYWMRMPDLPIGLREVAACA